MFGFLRRLFQPKSLEAHLRAKKLVKISGISFVIQRIRVLDHLQGSKVMTQVFDVYKAAAESGNKELSPSWKKVEEHFADVIIAGVVSPKIGREQGEGVICIKDMFNDWTLCSELYTEIMAFTNGDAKKKVI